VGYKPYVDNGFDDEEHGEEDSDPDVVGVDGADAEKHHEPYDFNCERDGAAFIFDEPRATCWLL
jgi:hypothetical protein